MILQRINLGLFALLGELSVTADWRRIAEEICAPFVPTWSTAWTAMFSPWADQLGGTG